MPTPTRTAFPRLSRTIDSIRADLYARIEAVQDEYAAKGWLPRRVNLNKGVVRGVLELCAWGLWQLYTLLEKILREAFPLYSSGAWLDLHGRSVGISRKPSSKARGMVRFFRREGVTENIVIPAGRIVRTLPDGKGDIYRYATLEEIVLPTGAAFVDVLVESEEYGSGANATVGQICELVTPVNGVSGVSNTADWLTGEGADVEEDASMQRRYVLEWQGQAGVTRAAYERAALSVTGVANVRVADQHPRGEGTVDVIVAGTAGLPTNALLEKVRSALDAAIVINHDLLVKAPTPVNVDVACTLELLSGDPATTRASAEAWIPTLFAGADVTFGIGVDVIRDRITSGLISLPGVKRVLWAAPEDDLEIPYDGLAVLASLSVSTTWTEAE